MRNIYFKTCVYVSSSEEIASLAIHAPTKRRPLPFNTAKNANLSILKHTISLLAERFRKKNNHQTIKKAGVGHKLC